MMKPEHLKLAGIVTMVCGGMSSMGAGATGSDSPTLVTGRIIPMQGVTQDAMNLADAAAQDVVPAAQSDASDVVQTVDAIDAPTPEAATVALGDTRDVVYTAHSVVASAQDVAPVAGAADLAYAPDVPVASALDVAPVVSAAVDDVHVSDAQAVSAEETVPVVASVGSGVAPEGNALVAPAKNVAPAAASAASGVAHTLNATVMSATQATPTTTYVASVAVHAADVPATPTATATAGAPLKGAALKLGGTVDLPVASPHRAPSAGATHALNPTVDDNAATPRIAQKDDADPAWASADLVAVNDNRLDDMRGGFDLPSGLVVSFGITRAAFVNGNLVASTSFNIPDIGHMTAQQAQMLASANTGALIQTGLHNTVQSGALPGLTGAVIQNTLSNQQIQALTTINTTVNSLAAFKALNIGATINSALINAVHPR